MNSRVKSPYQVFTYAKETIMLTRKVPATALAVALLACATVSFAAEEKATHDMSQMTIDQQVEMAQTRADNEAVAKRFENEAIELEKRAGEHERLAKRYHSGIGVGPKASAASLASHCDNFVKNLRASATEAREMARLHRESAQHLAK
jgi:hypothetical protein